MQSFGVVRDARKVFPANELGGRATEPLVALDNASFTFDRGEFVSLLGPSGCGKTTLLRIVAGLISKTSGSIVVDGHEVTGPYGDYGFVFQSPSLMPWRNVLDNVLFPMEVLKRRTPRAVARAHELLDLVGLGGFSRSRPHQLSGGMQQRVALCRALIHSPKLLLMDEPFGALDDITRQHLDDELLGLAARQNLTVVFVTHSIFEAVYLSSRVIVLSRRPGRIVADIPIEARTRDAAFRVSPAFAMQAARLQAALLEGQQ